MAYYEYFFLKMLYKSLRGFIRPGFMLTILVKFKNLIKAYHLEMDIKLLAIVGLAIIASIGASRVPYNNEYYTEKPVGKTTLNWVYFWEELNDNPTTVPSDLTAVDCHLAPNIINWIPFSILFDRELNFDFDVLERGDSKQIV